MNHENLRSYLHDHLAGAVTGLELLDFLHSMHEDGPLAGWYAGLRREVEVDEQTLRGLAAGLGFAPGSARQTAAWIAEKLARIKLLLAGAGRESLGELEALEALALGIEGKRALWTALSTIAAAPPPVHALDLAGLQERAREQRARVETRRLEVASAAFGSPGRSDSAS